MTNRGPRGVCIALLASLLLAGCQTGYRNSAAACTTNFVTGNYKAAATVSATSAQEEGIDDCDGVAHYIEAGRTAQAARDYTASAVFFDAAYDKVRPYLDEQADTSIGEEFTKTVVNQTMADYRCTAPERIFMNTFQALNRLALGDFDAARVEFRRAYDWQQDAVAKNATRIEEASAAGETEAKSRNIDLQAATSNPNVSAQFDRYYGGVRAMKGYADYVNPFTIYLQGAFLLAAGQRADAETARQCFQRVAQMVSGPAAEFAHADLAAADAMMGGAAAPATTWVFLLSGVAPERQEFRLDIPIPVGDVNYVSVAFPYLVQHDGAPSGFVCHGSAEGRSGLLADVDSMVGNDFAQQLPAIIVQEVLSSAIKAFTTYELKKNAGNVGWLAGIVYQAASTSADLRIWRTLPKQIQVVRVPTPASGSLAVVTAEGRDLGAVSVETGVCNLVVITCPSNVAPPSVLAIPLVEFPEARPVVAPTSQP